MSNTVVRTNVLAMNSHRNLGLVSNQQARASRNLSSGFRINSAADDAAGLAISEGMRAQIRGMAQASRNTQDGISLIQTAEGYMQTITELAQRMRELSIQGANDTNNAEQRAFIAAEMAQMQSEIERIWDTATFNGQAVFAQGSTSIPLEGINEIFVEAMSDISEIDTTLLRNVVNAINADTSFTGTFAEFINTRTAEELLAITGDSDTFQPIANAYNAAQAIIDANNAIIAALPAGTVPGTANADQLALQQANAAIASATAARGVAMGNLATARTEVLSNVADAFAAIGDIADHFGTSTADTGTLAEQISLYMTGQGASDTGVFHDLRGLSSILTAGMQLDDITTPLTTTNHASDVVATINSALNALDNASAALRDFASANNFLQGQGILAGNFFLQVGPDGASTPGLGHSLQVSGVGGQLGDVIGIVDRGMQFIRTEIGGVSQQYMDGTAAGGSGLVDHMTFSQFTTDLDSFIGEVNALRAGLGAIQNRLEFTIENLDIARENLSASESRIRDADMALEMMRLTQANVLQQAATAMLAQGNQAPQNVLQLLG